MNIKISGLKFPCAYILQIPKITFLLTCIFYTQVASFSQFKNKILFTTLHMQSLTPHTNLINYLK